MGSLQLSHWAWQLVSVRSCGSRQLGWVRVACASVVWRLQSGCEEIREGVTPADTSRHESSSCGTRSERESEGQKSGVRSHVGQRHQAETFILLYQQCPGRDNDWQTIIQPDWTSGMTSSSSSLWSEDWEQRSSSPLPHVSLRVCVWSLLGSLCRAQQCKN